MSSLKFVAQKYCPICRNSIKKNFSLVMALNRDQQLIECNQCGLVFNNRYVSDLEMIYNKKYFSSNSLRINYGGYFDYSLMKPAILKDYFFAIEFIKRATKRKGQKPKIVEIGCGYGFFLEALLKEKVILPKYLAGIEINKKAAQKASRFAKIFNKKLERFKSKEKFDFVLAFELIEHLPDPKILVNKAAEMLKKGGHIILTTPDISSPLFKILKNKWPAIHPYFHNFYFTPQTICALFENKNQFKPVYIDKKHFLTKPWRHLRIRLSELFPIFSPALRLTSPLDNLLISFPSGGSMNVIFKKTS